MKPSPSLRSRARRIARALAEIYPDARCSLDFDGPLQLLIATILSAQCTDARVNQVTPALFARFPDAAAYAAAEATELEAIIRPTGFFRAKARNIRLCCVQIVEKFGGDVPRTMEELTPLAGVGRKTANVVLGNAFDTPGLPVDTHVGRLSRRLGLTTQLDPVKVESEITAMLPPSEWTVFGHRLILHGRAVCQARRPLCESCTLAKMCPKIGTKHEKSATVASTPKTRRSLL
jgi:endonuclease-3